MRDNAVPKKEVAAYPQETEGSKLAAEARQAFNNLSDEEMDHHFAAAMANIRRSAT